MALDTTLGGFSRHCTGPAGLMQQGWRAHAASARCLVTSIRTVRSTWVRERPVKAARTRRLWPWGAAFWAPYAQRNAFCQ